METQCKLISEELVHLGHQVEILDYRDFNLANIFLILAKVLWAESIFMMNVSLKALPFLIIGFRKIIISHHGFIGRSGFKAQLKLLASMTFFNICNSLAVQDSLPLRAKLHSKVVYPCMPPNKVLLPKVVSNKRNRPFLFIGRLQPEKGIHVLIESFAFIKDPNLKKLTIAGDGLLRDDVLKQAKIHGVTLEMLGWLELREVHRVALMHQVLIIPSLWDEPFGLVALDGLAAGCQIVSSNRGGLVEALGPFGSYLESVDPICLAKAMTNAVQLCQSVEQSDHVERALWLNKFTARTCALGYLQSIATQAKK